MLSNAYLLAKFRFDTAENERQFAKILPKTDQVIDRDVRTGRRDGVAGGAAAAGGTLQPAGYV